MTHPSHPLSHGLCTFSFEGRWFALDVDVVTEVVTVDAILRVPRSAPYVLGLFSLRGNPVVVVDLGEVLGFGSTRSKTAAGAKGSVLVVIKRGDLIAAFPVDRIDEVMQPNRGTITPPDADEHPAVACFFGTGDPPATRVFTVLDAEYLLDRMRARPAEKIGAGA